MLLDALVLFCRALQRCDSDEDNLCDVLLNQSALYLAVDDAGALKKRVTERQTQSRIPVLGSWEGKIPLATMYKKTLKSILKENHASGDEEYGDEKNGVFGGEEGVRV